MQKIYIKRNSTFLETGTVYKKVNDTWTEIQENDFLNYLAIIVPNFDGEVSLNNFNIVAPNNIESETFQCNALYNNTEISNETEWSIINGGSFANIDDSGLVSVLRGANSSTITILAKYNNTIALHDTEVTYKHGSTANTTSETSTDESGNSITTITTITENEDGSSYSESNSTISDENGNIIGTTESITTTNTDGSYESSSTNYDENGNATDTTNASGDTEGNISTQNIEYDESGNSIVTGYEIDTSGSQDGEKTFNGDGVNTEYYAFDITHGFILNIHFTINYNEQPPNQNENHHNILTMKRATPSPWYGFQLRQSNTTKNIILGTQFSTGNNTNTNITGVTTDISNEQEFDLTITYSPTASNNKFICYDNLNSCNVFTKNATFPDIEELRYLKVTIGYALDENGAPFRYSNIKVYNFDIKRT